MKWDLYPQNLMSEYHIRYGGYGGIGYYLVSDTYIALFSRFIACGAWEGDSILDFVSENQSAIQPDTLHADTQGQSVMWTSQGRDPQAASRSGWRCSGAARPRRASRGSGRPWRAPTPAYAARAGAGRKPGWSRSGSR